MNRLLTLTLIVLIAGLMGVGSVMAQGAASRTRTVFGRGPELHLLPRYGAVGTTIMVVGLGYRAGARVRVLAGPPGAEFDLRPLAHATASSQGMFRTSFRVTCRLAAGRRASNGQCQATPKSLIIGGFVGNSFSHKRTVTAAFITGVSAS
jgi:hypothetical protein